jgi:type I restriction enzyme S subunit
MAGEWQSAKFAEICEHSAFGPRFAGGLYAADGNVATLRTTDISVDGRIEYETMPLAHLDLGKFQQHVLRVDDLVITRSGRVGTTALFNGFRLPVLPGAFLIRFRLKHDIAEPRFYRYFFSSPVGQELLTSVATGSVQQNLNITSLHGLQVPVPPLPEQRAIACILGTLDDKIELNRRTNETLEEMARA